MLTYLFAVPAGCANASSSVLQRKADSTEPGPGNLSLRLIMDLLRNPIWFVGILMAGFGLQAAALSSGPLAEVEPILIIELPLTLLLVGAVYGQRLQGREWTAAAAMTAGLAGLLYFVAPAGGSSVRVRWSVWAIGIGVSLVAIGALVELGRRGSSIRRAALLGVAAGSTFGLTAAFIKAVTNAASAHGLVAIFRTWQTYAMVAAGGFTLFLLQSALNAGPLVAAQPGLTAANPVLAFLWGVLVFGGESVRSGFYLLLAAAAAGVVGWAVFRLSHSSLLAGDDEDGDGDGDGDGEEHACDDGAPAVAGTSPRQLPDPPVGTPATVREGSVR